MENITIPMEEYKELLMIKGKYQELKSNQTIQLPTWREPSLTRTLYGTCEELPKPPYKTTCTNRGG